MEKCFFCKGDLKDGFDNYMAEVNKHFVIIKNVPCHICSQCGAVSYDIDTAEKLEGIINSMSEATAEVEVVEYVA